MFKRSQLLELENDLIACRACAFSRTNPVLGEGNPDAKVLFIGEAPGKNEDLQGRPFVGRSGQLLDSILLEHGLSREKNIYITNMIRCRPPENRDPLPQETSSCSVYLARTIEILSPKIIVAVGRIAATNIIDKGFKVMTDHGKTYEKDGILYMGILHPAAILRNPNNRPLLTGDIAILAELLKCHN